MKKYFLKNPENPLDTVEKQLTKIFFYYIIAYAYRGVAQR